VSAETNGEVTSYYGKPLIKEPVWSWEIPTYFFFGGLGGASAGLAYLARLNGNQVLARRAWAASLLGLGVSPPLLISDLGRPMRFFNMLRVFKITSPMNTGTWILSANGIATGFAAVNAWTGLFPGIAVAARPVAALAGLPVSTYTAALVADTAVPAWHEAHRTLPFVFAGGAAASAGAAAVMSTPAKHAGPARRLTVVGAALELGATELMERRLGHVVGRPYREGAAGRLATAAKALVSAGALTVALGGARSRNAARAGGGLVLAGAMCERWSVFQAGLQSARDPASVVTPQRERMAVGSRA